MFQRKILQRMKETNATSKDVLPNINCTQAANHPPRQTEWCHLLLHDFFHSKCVPFHCCQGVIGVHDTFLSWWPWPSIVTFKLVQVREGPNTSSMWLLLLLRPFNGLFSRTTWVSRHQKGKPFWIFTGARDDGVETASAGPYANRLHLTPDR